MNVRQSVRANSGKVHIRSSRSWGNDVSGNVALKALGVDGREGLIFPIGVVLDHPLQ
jgi:hypothetical protein